MRSDNRISIRRQVQVRTLQYYVIQILLLLPLGDRDLQSFFFINCPVPVGNCLSDDKEEVDVCNGCV